MKRKLIIMRHATAAGASGGTDHARVLTSRGVAEAERVGMRLRELDAVPDEVLCSSAIRCRQTWEAVKTELGKSPPIHFEDALYNSAAPDLLHGIAAVADARTLLLLAHNPGVSMLAFELGSQNPLDAEALRAGFAPGTVALFEVDGEWSELSRRTTRLIHAERPEPN